MNAPEAAVARGRDALARRSWTEARHAFTEALAMGHRADAYEGLAEATAWLDDDGAIEAYEQAYGLYREAGEDLAAARVAAFTAIAVHDFRGQLAVVQGKDHAIDGQGRAGVFIVKRHGQRLPSCISDTSIVFDLH